MRMLFTFVLGVLVGWLAEWIIDYFYWRKRYAELAITKQQDVQIAQPPKAFIPIEKPIEKRAPDDLKIIKGIGPVIERKLNEAGIFTFDELGRLTADDLRGLLGKLVQRLADEDDLLQQARDLARKKK